MQLAEPGAFTRRAFANGRLDLVQVEGLADLMTATTDAQRRQALAHTSRDFSAKVERWRATLITAMANSTALLDFSDEPDFDGRADDRQLAAVCCEIDAEVADAARGARIRDGLTVALIGSPNVGKSSVLNAMAGRDAAIVSSIPGTTRDVIEADLNLAGVLVTLLDTAGDRATADPLEQQGIERARARAATADLVIHIVDQDEPGDDTRCVVINKIDLRGGVAGTNGSRHYLSTVTGDGIAAFRQWLTRWAHQVTRPGDPPLVARRRQVDALVDCVTALRVSTHERDPVLKAEALRSAAHSLGRLTGNIGVEDVLDQLFASFCIGK